MMKVTRRHELQKFADGETIFVENESSSEMFVVRSGKVEISKSVGDHSMRLAVLERGSFFGEMSLLEGLPRSATARAIGAVELLVLKPGSLLLQIRRDPTFAFELLQQLSGRIRDLNEKLAHGGIRKPARAIGVHDGCRGRISAQARGGRRIGDVMKTTVRENRLLVVSDVHMGNRLHRTRRAFTDFVQFALDHRYSVCINGDGIDIVQLSLSHLVSDITPSLGLFLKFGDNDLRIYYTVGNHDIALEHFLNEVGRMRVVPFLSVESGDQRIRVEHGHMYDDMFLRFPRLYYSFTLIGRLAIGISPGFYQALHKFNDAFIAFSGWALSGFGLFAPKKDLTPDENTIVGERKCFREGAEALGSRGFDAVVFGHTHYEGTATLSDGIKYYNTGAWFGDP